MVGVVFFGAGLILTSLLQISALLDYSRYWYLFQDWPTSTIAVRYAISWVARIVGLAAGIGVLCRREPFRKTVVVLAGLTLLSVPWKHPYQGFVRHIADLRQRMPLVDFGFNLLALHGISAAQVTWIAVLVTSAQEALLALLLLWYFTRPRVKAQFH